MSSGARWLLGSFAVTLGGIFLYSARVEDVGWECCAGAIVCGLIAAACFSSKARQAAVRIVGAFVFAIFSLLAATEGAVASHLANALPGVTGSTWPLCWQGLCSSAFQVSTWRSTERILVGEFTPKFSAGSRLLRNREVLRERRNQDVSSKNYRRYARFKYATACCCRSA